MEGREAVSIWPDGDEICRVIDFERKAKKLGLTYAKLRIFSLSLEGYAPPILPALIISSIPRFLVWLPLC
jgi:hypothetical protein